MKIQRKFKNLLLGVTIAVGSISILTPLLVSCSNTPPTNPGPNDNNKPDGGDKPNDPNLPNPSDEWTKISPNTSRLAFDVWKGTQEIKQSVKNGIIVFDPSVRIIKNQFEPNSNQIPQPTPENQKIYDSVTEIVFLNDDNGLYELNSFSFYNFSKLEKITFYDEKLKKAYAYRLPKTLSSIYDYILNPHSPLFANIDKLQFNGTSLSSFSVNQGEKNIFGYKQPIDLSGCKDLNYDDQYKQNFLKKFPNGKLPPKQ